MFIKKLNKNGQISIPKKIQKWLNINDGDLLTIYKNKDFIIIKNSHPNKRLNQCVLNSGRLSIPVELRRILHINIGTSLLIEVSGQEEAILTKHESVYDNRQIAP